MRERVVIHSPRQKGQSVVELALVLPLLLMLLLGMVQLGLILNAQQLLVYAAGEGARMAALTGRQSQSDAAIRLAMESLTRGDSDGLDISYEPAPSGDTWDRDTVLRISVRYQMSLWIPFFSNSTMDVSGSATCLTEVYHH